jgi:hypothetical protein
MGTSRGGLKDNAGFLEDDINEVEWQGARAAIRWLVNDNWTVTATTNFQDLEAEGFNDYDPNRGDLKTVKFADEYRTDEWHQTSLVIEGDLGFAQLVSATSYYDRDVFYAHDTQSYAAYFNYVYGFYYVAYDFGDDTIGYLTNEESNESFTQEIRLTGSSERTNWTAGIFTRTLISTGISIPILTTTPALPRLNITQRIIRASHPWTTGGIPIRGQRERISLCSASWTLTLQIN